MRPYGSECDLYGPECDLYSSECDLYGSECDLSSSECDLSRSECDCRLRLRMSPLLIGPKTMTAYHSFTVGRHPTPARDFTGQDFNGCGKFSCEW